MEPLHHYNGWGPGVWGVARRNCRLGSVVVGGLLLLLLILSCVAWNANLVAAWRRLDLRLALLADAITIVVGVTRVVRWDAFDIALAIAVTTNKLIILMGNKYFHSRFNN